VRSFGRIVALAFLLASLALLGSPAAAGSNWCEGDPVFSVSGNVLDVTSSFSSDQLPNAGPLTYVLLVPSNAPLTVVVATNGDVPVRASVSRTLAPDYSLFSMPAVLRVSMAASRAFSLYTRITGVTTQAQQTTVLDTQTGPSTSVLEYRFTMPLSATTY
jgi:hypothetical protein